MQIVSFNSETVQLLVELEKLNVVNIHKYNRRQLHCISNNRYAGVISNINPYKHCNTETHRYQNFLLRRSVVDKEYMLKCPVDTDDG